MSDIKMPRAGKCPECGGVYSLKKDGRLRVHGYRVHCYYATGPECAGSRQLPEEKQ